MTRDMTLALRWQRVVFVGSGFGGGRLRTMNDAILAMVCVEMGHLMST